MDTAVYTWTGKLFFIGHWRGSVVLFILTKKCYATNPRVFRTASTLEIN